MSDWTAANPPGVTPSELLARQIQWAIEVRTRKRTATPSEVLQCCRALKKATKFGDARKLLDVYLEKPPKIDDPRKELDLFQTHSLCTYKDPDLPPDKKYQRALEILNKADRLVDSVNPETLGQAGAIYKRKWQYDGQIGHLLSSRAYYLRACDFKILPPEAKPGEAAQADDGPRVSLQVARDYGYTAINAAFILDLIASVGEGHNESGGRSGSGVVQFLSALDDAKRQRDVARKIREAVLNQYPGLATAGSPAKDAEHSNGAKTPEESLTHSAWWFWSTLAEAAFGLGRDDEAVAYLRQGAKLEAPKWEVESTVRQLADLARIRAVGPGAGDAWRVLYDGFREGRREYKITEYLARAAVAGKMGLAFSGGGFRASLYHIGVLARLAELDILRHVDVISCVSGGSIIGAYYYLKLREQLETHEDEGDPEKGMTRDVYLQIVRDIEREFLEGVQANIRMLMIGSFTANLRMFFQPGYSRTRKIGDLLEKHLFARVLRPRGREPLHADPRFEMRNLRVNVPGPQWEGFEPKTDNWRRSAKVPILILNATTLNTGHNWQFTTSFLGEPPGAIVEEVDANERLRRLYYHDAPKRPKPLTDRLWSLFSDDAHPPRPVRERLRLIFNSQEKVGHQTLRLGQAVAASACVPGVFEPIALEGLYSGRTVRLVDGGVHDNQGTTGLLEQNCNLLLVSDACGQVGVEKDPASRFYNVAIRANNILMERVRWAQYRDLANRRRAGVLQGLMYIHLKLDLDVDPKDWIDCKDESPLVAHKDLTEYVILKKVQTQLASIRTDLDSFSDAEAYALMTSGYLMTRHTYPETIERALKGVLPEGSRSIPMHDWDFRSIEGHLQRHEPGRVGGLEHKDFTRLLDVASHCFFKIWQLVPALKWSAVALACVLIASFFGACWTYPHQVVVRLTLGWLGAWAAGLIAFVAVGAWLGQYPADLLWYRQTPRRVLAGLIMALGGVVLVKLHRGVFNRLYLRWGRVRRG